MELIHFISKTEIMKATEVQLYRQEKEKKKQQIAKIKWNISPEKSHLENWEIYFRKYFLLF